MNDFIAKPLNRAGFSAVLARWLPSAGALPAVEPAAPVVSAGPVGERVVELLRDLLPLIDNSMFDAIARYQEVSAATAGSVLADVIDNIGVDLGALRFDRAALRLRELGRAQGWTLPERPEVSPEAAA